MSARSRTVAVTAIGPMIWGTTYVVTSELLPPGRPLTAAVLRALPIGIVLTAAAGVLPKGRWWWRTAVLGALNFAVFLSMLFTAAYRLPGGVAATVGALQPLLVMALATVLLREQAGWRRVIAGLLGVAGVALLVLNGDARLDMVGVAAAAAGAGSMATGSVLVQRWGRPTSVSGFAGWQLTAGGLMLAPIALVAEGIPSGLTGRNVAGYAYLAVIGGGLAWWLWFRGIDRLGAGPATFLSLCSPLVATTITLLRGESMSALQFVGAGAVIASVVIAQRASARTASLPQRQPTTPLPRRGGRPDGPARSGEVAA